MGEPTPKEKPHGQDQPPDDQQAPRPRRHRRPLRRPRRLYRRLQVFRPPRGPGATVHRAVRQRLPARHWGVVLEGTRVIRYTDNGEDVIEAGDAYYAPPGHL